MSPLPTSPLGASGLEVSRLSLGSWRTFEQIPREAGLAVMTAAREAGITFLDDARYNDETGDAPIPTGYSEVVFGELFRGAGWAPDAVIVANKLWWEFWPEQDAVAELAGSLDRMGLDHVDLIYSSTLPDEIAPATAVEQIAPLLASGAARSWGVVNWTAEALDAAIDAAERSGLPMPCAVQLPYSLVRRDWVEGEAMVAALERSGASVVASYSLAGGILSGKYAQPGASGREAERLEEEGSRAALAAAVELGALAERLGTTSATLAIAFTLANPHVASTLFGATRPEQITENVAAADLAASLDAATLAELRAIGG